MLSPTYNFFAIAIPPAVVNVPPFVILVASVVLEMATPPLIITAPVELLVLLVESFDTNLGNVKVLVAYVIVDGDCITPVPFPKSTAFAVKVAAPVPPYVAVITPAFHTPDVIFAPIDKSVPTNNFFAIPIPPAVVKVPPFVALVASVVLDELIPPIVVSAPVVLLVDAILVETLT